jgi:hydrogenase small subunit
MEKLNRRQFLKICTASAAAIGLSSIWVPAIAEAFKKASGGDPPIIWLQGSACNGCSTSMLNTANPGMRELFTEIVNMSFHPGFAGQAGTGLIDNLRLIAEKSKGKFILVVEGALPKAAEGAYNIFGEDSVGRKITLTELLTDLGGPAKAVVAIGSCASFGGISAAAPNPAKCVGLEKFINVEKVLNVPGCPPHPDWIVGTLSHLLLFGMPEQDKYGRPTLFYNGLIHNNCPRRQYFDNSIFAEQFGDEGCLLQLGCKGPLAHGDCPTRLWNGASSWCVGSNAPCIGCTDPGFPDLTMPFYKQMPQIHGPGITSTADTIGLGLGIATAAGLAAHLAGNYLTGRVGSKKGDREEDL